ncbi:PilW family protein [Marinobacter sp. S6332]|uniref:PilW family protein n=1 Tax=Marinobacter sp. S6332 TaxID=2926403 RepID=UPI001FF3B69F|nr:PilW family protein [Marinobacter sp. S6332]MCK0165002.1 PilW family protein [Marinobacter sp. S6332]
MMNHQLKREKPLFVQQLIPSKMAGLSLIELMIAMLLGIILTLGATQVYLGTSQSYRLTDAIAHGQENIRFVSSMMQRDVRSAGGLACLQSAGEVDDKLNLARVVPVGDGVLGWEAAGTGIGAAYNAVDSVAAGSGDWTEGSGAGTFPVEITGEVVKATDVLIVNSVQTLPVDVTGSTAAQINLGAASGLPEGQVVLAVTDDCSAGELFQNTATDGDSSVSIAGGASAPGNAAPASFDLAYGTEARIASYSTVAYYIGVRNDASGNSTPVLYRQRLDARAEGPQELVAGVESMQILYGLSSGVLKRADSYTTADNVTSWEDVVSVRVAFVVRSENGANSEKLQRVFNLLGTEVTTLEDRRARLVATSTIGLRNRLE